MSGNFFFDLLIIKFLCVYYEVVVILKLVDIGSMFNCYYYEIF